MTTQGPLALQVLSTTVFHVFEDPVAIKQIQFDSGGAQLPIHRVQDSGPRHAIVVFEGDLSGIVVDIRIVV
jgi:hypothetical protein